MPIVPKEQAAPAAAGGTVPFQVGSFHYCETIATDSFVMTAGGGVEFVHNITPGGFLRGVDILVTSSGGTTGAITTDGALAMFSSISVENIDGSPIIYPMTSFSLAQWQKYSAPWLGEPKNPAQLYSNAMATPGFYLHMWPEIYGTAGVLANTDARAQYRVRYTFAPAANVATGYTVFPTVTVVTALQAWAQPDRADLHGNSINPVPPGLNLARIVRHQSINLAAAGGTNLVQVTNTGNEIRNIIIIIRDQTNARVDAVSGVFRIRLDDRSLGVYTPNELFDRAVRFYPSLQNNTFPRDTGVYVLPRFNSPTPDNGTMLFGDGWLPTSNATFLTFEFTTAAGPTGGTIEIITDEVVPVGAIPMEIEGA